MFVITRFVNYIGNNSSAIDKAPVLYGKGVIEKIEFIPKHDKTITRKTGKYRTITNTYPVADAYSIKVNGRGVVASVYCGSFACRAMPIILA